MNCLICQNTIDDKKDFTVKGPQGQDLDDVVGRLRHFEELGKWTHVTLTAQFAFTQVLLSGHVCPSHRIDKIGLVDTFPVAPVQIASPTVAPSTSPKTQAPAAPTAAAATQNPATPTVRRKETQS